MKKNQNLNTIQPISNLKNYNKNIKPVLDSGKAVHLTRRGKDDWIIMTSKQANNLRNHGVNELLGILLKRKLDNISDKNSITPDELIKKLKEN